MAGVGVSTMTNELFKPVVGFEGLYEVGSLGTVKSLHTYKGRKPGKILKARINKRGYPVVYLRNKSSVRNVRIHRLIAEAWLPNTDQKSTVNHIDGNKLNNTTTNLEWSTVSENVQHAYDTGLTIPARGSTHYNAKLTEDDVREIRKSELTNIEVARKTGVTASLVSLIRAGKRWEWLAE